MFSEKLIQYKKFIPYCQNEWYFCMNKKILKLKQGTVLGYGRLEHSGKFVQDHSASQCRSSKCCDCSSRAAKIWYLQYLPERSAFIDNLIYSVEFSES